MKINGKREKSVSLAKVVPAASLSLALISTVLNVFLFLYAHSRYCSEQSIRMDPTGAARFVPLNAKLKPPIPGRRRIVLFGDSRIEGWNPALRVDNVEFINQGWWGETTGQALLRLDRDVIQLRPTTVIIQYGINDLKGIGLLPGQENEIIETCRQNIELMVDRLREHKINVVLLTIFPVGPISLMRRPVWSYRILEAIDRVNHEIGSLAGPDVEVVECDSILGESGRMKRSFATDEFHLTPAAYVALNRVLQPKLAVGLSPSSLH